MSLPKSVDAIVVDSSTFDLPTTVATPKPITFGSQVLTPGSSITVSSTVVSLGDDGKTAFANGTPVVVPPAETSQESEGSSGAAPVLTVGMSTYTAQSNRGFAIDSQTLVPGSTIAVDGTVVSLAATGGVAVMETSTEALTTPLSSSGNGGNVGGYVWSALGGTGVTATASIGSGGANDKPDIAAGTAEKLSGHGGVLIVALAVALWAL